jgi:hypothetical protein
LNGVQRPPQRPFGDWSVVDEAHVQATQRIDRAFDVEPGGSLFEVAGAATRAANGPSLSLAERSELQEVGGRMLSLAEAGHRWL